MRNEKTINPPEQADFPTCVKRVLPKLMFDEVLDGSNWMIRKNRDSINEFVHYYESPDFRSELTLGALIDADERHLMDACNKAFGDKSTITREEFLASFLEGLSGKNLEKRLKLSQDIDKLEAEKREQFKAKLQDFLLRRQIPAENLYLALGIYVLQKAEEGGIVVIKGDTIERTPTGQKV